MLTHNTHYPTDSKFLTVEDCLPDGCFGFVVYDTLTSKYFTSSASWSKYISKAEVYSSRSVIKSVFPELRYAAKPVKGEVF